MKICPVCDQTYTDQSLNFCLNDGASLNVVSSSVADEPPPTVVMDAPRKTNPNFSEQQSSFGNPNQQIYQPPFAAPSVIHKQDQTLPIISLVLGVLGLVLICCYGGIPLGAGAMITGYLGMSNANKDPMQYGGKGLAIGGIVLGAISILVGLIMVLIAIASNL